MFHIKSLELVHWDYWQRIKNIPLDAKIITIAGQNGSGKTTLLDALRTLFGLDCSMGRTYKHYARHAGQQTSWLRAVVDNRPVGPQLSNRPFRSSGFVTEDEVTLICQIQRNGGDWKRQYMIQGGRLTIEDVVENNEWLGVETYRKRLANAGLSPAIAKVLALEQGETDKLCEYAPRQLLDLVFQVFGDKEVLDAYDEAKRHQRDTEAELQRFESELEAARTNLEGLRLRVANFHQWEGLQRERQDLQEQILPSLHYHEARAQAARISSTLRDARQALLQQDENLSSARELLAQRANALSMAQKQEAALETERIDLEKRLQDINARLKPLESLLEQKNRLQRLADDAGADIAALTQKLEQKEKELLQWREAREKITSRLSQDRTAIANLQSKTALPEPDNVRSMRRALQDAGIRHVLLPEIVEVTDARWQGAVEGMLRSYAFVILLERASDAPAAFKIGEKERYSHFIVADRVEAPEPNDDSLLSVVRFSAPAPAWLIEQLERVSCVDSVEQGMRGRSGDEWITPEAYHRERRGGRSLYVEPARYRFGDSGRAQSLAALQKALPALEQEEDQLTFKIGRLSAEISELKAGLAGVDAAKELVARQAEFQEAEHSATPLKNSRTEVGTRLGEIFPLIKQATEQRTRAESAWQQAKNGLTDGEQQAMALQRRHREERAGHARNLQSLRTTWRHLPHGWRRPTYGAALFDEHQNAHQVELRIKHLGLDLERDDWETDSTVVDQFVRLNSQLQQRQTETDERRYQNNRAIEATANARGAYIERLRYTIKAYSRNIKELGELAGIDVHTDPVKLENDDLLLMQAGLHVRFKFDGKGPIGLNDGEASGGQQVMKSLILLIGLLKSDEGSGGFVFIDEPFAHLDIRNIQLVGEFLKNTDAQYLMTTPLTHNTDVYDPSELTLITTKKKKEDRWAQPIFVLQRQTRANQAA